MIKPFNPHDASSRISAELPWLLDFPKHKGLRRKYSWNCFSNNNIVFHLPPTSNYHHPQQVKNCGVFGEAKCVCAAVPHPDALNQEVRLGSPP